MSKTSEKVKQRITLLAMAIVTGLNKAIDYVDHKVHTYICTNKKT